MVTSMRKRSNRSNRETAQGPRDPPQVNVHCLAITNGRAEATRGLLRKTDGAERVDSDNGSHQADLTILLRDLPGRPQICNQLFIGFV